MSQNEKKDVPIVTDPKKHLETFDRSAQGGGKNRHDREPRREDPKPESHPVKQNPSRPMSENANKGISTKTVSFATLVVSIVVLCVAFGIYANTIPRPCPTLPELAKQTFGTYDASYKQMIEAKKSIPAFIK